MSEGHLVREWMTAGVETIAPDDLLEHARERMERGRFRRLPVVDRGGRLVGIITEGDLRQQHGYLAVTRVRAAMVENPITARPDDTIEHAASVMLARKIGGLPVVDADGRPIGILTETDVIRGLLGATSDAETRGRLDVELVARGQTLGEMLGIVEAEGGRVLGLEVRDTGPRIASLRLSDGDLERIADALRERGYGIRAVPPKAT